MARPKVLPLTVFLLKAEKVADFRLAHMQTGDEVEISVPLVARVRFFPGDERWPPWVEELRPHIPSGVSNQLVSRSPSALMQVQGAGRTFVLTFGSAWQKLDIAWTEPDFGLRVVLNAIEPDRLIEVKAEQVFARWHLASERAPKAASVREFGVEFDRDLVAVMEGNPTDGRLGKTIRGGTSLRISTSLSGLEDLLPRIRELFSSVNYKVKWPEIDNLRPIADPSRVAAADVALEAEMAIKGWDTATLFTPLQRREEALEAHSYVFGSVGGNPAHSPYLRIESWLSHLTKRGELPSVTSAKSSFVHLFDDQHDQMTRVTVYDCLGCEVSLDQKQLILSGGRWYEATVEFIKQVNDRVVAIPSPEQSLPAWDEMQHEGPYNSWASGKIGGLLFDANNLQYGGGASKLEFCDVLHLPTRTLYFVKVASRSSGMSHLLEQVRRTAELFFGSNPLYRQRLAGIVTKSFPKLETTWLNGRAKPGEWNICLVSMGRSAADLPFFARSGLARLVRELEQAGHNVSFQQV